MIKRIVNIALIICLALCFVCPVKANEIIIAKKKAGATCTDTTSSGLLIRQGAEAFDNTDCSTSDVGDNSETWNCAKGTGSAINLADTTSPLRGSKMVSITGGTTGTDYGIVTSPTFSQSGNTIYFHMLIKPVTTVASHALAYIYHTGLGLLCSYTAQYNNKIRVESFGGASADTTDGITDNTAYHLWGSYTKGTGADAICTAEFTAIGVTSPVGSGNKYAASTNGNHNAVNATNVALAVSLAEVISFDQIIVSDTAISGVCE